MIQRILLSFLSFSAKTLIALHRPYIIGITGTVGKTTITEHLAKFLESVYGKENVGYSLHHYNGEYGLPLTIIGAKTGGKNIFLWVLVFFQWVIRLFTPYPKYLILEYGIDHPGEMDFLLDIAKPDIVFITEIAPNHLEQFLTLENYRNEKLKITKKTSCVIAHSSQRQYIDCEATFFGIGAMADFDVSHVRIDETGTHAKINAKDTSYQLNLPVFGVFHIENILPLYIIAEKFGIDGASVGRYLEDFRPQSGRSGMIEGISNATIIDGSYNGGYLSIREGVSALIPPFSAGRIILLLGDMRELGKETESIHKMLAHDMNNIIPPTADVHFFLVGPYMEKYFAPSLDTRFHPFVTLSSEEAGEKVRDFLMENEKMRTTIFVKGSQNTIFLEEAIKKVLLHPSDEKLLCRQSKDWMKKKRAFFEGVKKDL